MTDGSLAFKAFPVQVVRHLERYSPERQHLRAQDWRAAGEAGPTKEVSGRVVCPGQGAVSTQTQALGHSGFSAQLLKEGLRLEGYIDKQALLCQAGSSRRRRGLGPVLEQRRGCDRSCLYGK